MSNRRDDLNVLYRNKSGLGSSRHDADFVAYFT